MQKLYIFILALVISGCAIKTGNQFLESASNTEISCQLVKNHTTKNEVRKMFGDPIDINFTNNNMELWIYKFQKSAAKMGNFVPVFNAFYKGTNDNTKKLQVIFNHDDTVHSFYYSDTQGETKYGLFQ